MTAVHVYEAPLGIDLDGLEVAILEAFHRLRDAVAGGSPAVVIIRESDLLGHGDAADAALANALLGLVRALATEGLREGWVVNALSIPDDLAEAVRRAWIDRLSEPQGISGAVIRLGELHLGRAPV
jgi:hypothetical protein